MCIMRSLMTAPASSPSPINGVPIDKKGKAQTAIARERRAKGPKAPPSPAVDRAVEPVAAADAQSAPAPAPSDWDEPSFAEQHPGYYVWRPERLGIGAAVRGVLTVGSRPIVPREGSVLALLLVTTRPCSGQRPDDAPGQDLRAIDVGRLLAVVLSPSLVERTQDLLTAEQGGPREIVLRYEGGDGIDARYRVRASREPVAFAEALQKSDRALRMYAVDMGDCTAEQVDHELEEMPLPIATVPAARIDVAPMPMAPMPSAAVVSSPIAAIPIASRPSMPATGETVVVGSDPTPEFLRARRAPVVAPPAAAPAPPAPPPAVAARPAFVMPKPPWK
jgi:hypothetical protein